MGLVLFAALGTEICLSADTSPLVAVILGVTTAVTGGMFRDIICNEIPLVLSREIYATAAFVASCGYVLGDSLGLPANCFAGSRCPRGVCLTGSGNSL